jgi:tetratricopeptide (TPR) repeat protein
MIITVSCATLREEPVDTPDESGLEQELPDLYESISLLVQSGDPVAAVREFEEAEARDPDNPETQTLFANLLTAAGAFSEAESVLASVLEKAPDNPDALFLSALLAGARGDRSAQEAQLRHLLERNPDDARAHAALGEMYMESRRLKDAKASFEKSLEHDPDHFVALVGLGAVLIRERKNDQAEAVLTRAIASEPEYPFAYVDRSRARMRSQNLDGAEADLDTAIALDPEYVWNYIDRGRLRAQTGRLEKAIADYNSAIDLEPDIFITYVYRGYAQASLGNTEQAIDDLNYALTLRPEYHPVLAPLGTQYFIMEDWNKAHEMFVQAYSHADQEHSYPLLAALALKFDGRERDARRYLEQVVTAMPRNSLYYQMGRYYMQPGSDGHIYQLIQRERDPLMKTRMNFFLAGQYEIQERTRSAQALYNAVKDEPFQGLIEHRLARARLDRYR